MFEVDDKAIARLYLVESPTVEQRRYCRILEIGANAKTYLVNIQTDRGKCKLDNSSFRSHVGWISAKDLEPIEQNDATD